MCPARSQYKTHSLLPRAVGSSSHCRNPRNPESNTQSHSEIFHWPKEQTIDPLHPYLPGFVKLVWRLAGQPTTDPVGLVPCTPQSRLEARGQGSRKTSMLEKSSSGSCTDDKPRVWDLHHGVLTTTAAINSRKMVSWTSVRCLKLHVHCQRRRQLATIRPGSRLRTPSGSSRNPQCGDLKPSWLLIARPSDLCPGLLPSSHIHQNRRKNSCEACDGSSHCLPGPLPG